VEGEDMSKASRRIGAIAAALALVVAGPWAVGALGQENGNGDGEKSVFTIGDDNKIGSLNPLVGIEAPEYTVWSATYDLLVDFDQKDLSPAPGLATEWEVADDGLTWTFQLREGMTWQDGEPITADDVAYTYNRVIEEQNGSLIGYLTLVDTVTATDDLTLEIVTKKPTPLMTSIFIYILPEHIWSKISTEDVKTFENVPAVGSGPFELVEHREGQFVRLEANENYWGDGPQVDEVIYRFFNNPDAAFQALKAGEIDYTFEIAPNLFNQLENDEAITTHEAVINSFDEIAFNTGSTARDNFSDLEPHGDGHPALMDVRVRQAIAHAVDKQTLVDKVIQGHGTVAHGVVTPAAAPAVYHWEPSEDEVFAFDIDEANRILDEAGYEDTDGDEVREMPDGGEPLRFRYFVRSENTDTVKTSQFVRGWLNQIGIETEITALSDNKLTTVIQGGEYDMFHWGWFPDPDPDFILSIFTCGQRPPNAATYRNSDSFYCTPEYDRLYEEQKTTIDLEERVDVVHEMQQMLYEDVPYLMLWYDNDLEAYRNQAFTGFRPQPAPNGDLLSSYSFESIETVAAETTEDSGGGGSSAIWIGVAAVVVLAVGALLVLRRKGAEGDRA
jgi:peptide/nickel transport system substrate-binding protein